MNVVLLPLLFPPSPPFLTALPHPVSFPTSRRTLYANTGGVATPADAALMMQLGMDGVFVGSGIFKSGDPASRARAIVQVRAGQGLREHKGKGSIPWAFGRKSTKERVGGQGVWRGVPIPLPSGNASAAGRARRGQGAWARPLLRRATKDQS
mgnify:CR=1 FL=1